MRNRWIASALIIVSTLTTLSGVWAEESIPAAASSLEPQMQALMERYHAVGLAAAVVKDGQLIYTGAWGLKNRESGEPLSETDLFRIASISKSFSATAIMQLVEAGKVSLDDDAGELVGFRIRNPLYPDEVITLRMLLSHTSSLNDSQGYFRLDVINPATNEQSGKCYSDYKPGTRYRYCNLNFNLVGTIIERVSGVQFDKYIKQHILDPLQLDGGYRVVELDAARFATLYEYDAEKQAYTASPDAYHPRHEEFANYQMGYSTPVFSPTGGMKLSAPDLARYMMMHMQLGEANGVRIISTESARMMQTPVNAESGYGLAITTSKSLIPGKTLKGHTGSSYGLYSQMFFSPEEKFGIVLITNGCDARRSDGSIEFLRLAARALYAELIDAGE